MADDVALTSTPDTTGGNPIDVTTVVTAAGTVKRERVSLGAADLDRDVTVTAAGALLVDPGGATQPISAASLPLPTGASTEATLALIKAKTDNLDVALSTRTKPADTQTVSGTVSVGNFPAIQPVSDNAGSLTVDGSVSVSNFPALQPVSDNGGSLTVDGTVTAAAQPGVDIGDVTINNASGASAVNVQDGGNVLSVDDGAGSLTVDNGTLSVTGGGTEATALRVTLASDSTGLVSVDDNGATLSVDDGAGSLTIDNAALAVVGSGTEATALRVTVATDSTGVLSVDDNGGLLSVVDGGGWLTVDNTVLSVVGGGTEATAQRVTIATDSTGVLSVDDNGGSLTIDGSLNVSQFGGTNVVTGTGASGAGIPRVTLSNDSTLAANQSVNVAQVGAVAVVAGGKATQQTNALPTQDMKDAGRVIKLYGGFKFTPATTEALVTLTPVSDGTAGSTGTSFTVTSGKRLRLQAMTVTIHASSTTSVGVMVSLRMTASGSVSASSPLVATIGAGLVGTQVAHCATSNHITFPDGLELSGTMQFGISQIGIATADATVTLVGYEY